MSDSIQKQIKNNLVLELHVPNFEKERKFYSLFGFKEISYEPKSDGGNTLGYLVLGRDDVLGSTMINFYGDNAKVANHSYFSRFPTSTPRGYGVEIVINVSDINTLWGEIKGKILKEQIAQELTLKRWGKSDFRVIDPFGFYIRFTEPVDWEK